MRGTLALVVLLMPLAGCLTNEDSADGALDDQDVLDLFHDHTDYSLHTRMEGVEFLAWDTLGMELGSHGFANFDRLDTAEGSRIAVAIDGDQDGGFVLANVADDGRLEVLGSYFAPGSGFQEVRFLPDGRHVLLNVQEIPGAAATSQGVERACSICIHIVSIEDPANPSLVGVLPVELLGTHNLQVVEYADAVYVFYVGQPLTNDPPGNFVGIARVVDGPTAPVLVPVNRFMWDTSNDDGRSFPHDVLVQEHPLTNQMLAYVSHWNGGFQVWDVSEPLLPILEPLAVHQEAAPSLVKQTHWIMQETRVREDGRVIAWSAPEIGVLEEGTGVIRAFDVSDPTAIAQIGTWSLPGDLWIPGQYLLSPHIAIPHPDEDLLLVSHYHAGTWILDTSSPEAPKAVAVFEPHGDANAPYDGPFWWKKPNFDPEGFGPNVYMSRWVGDEVWITDRGTGFYRVHVEL